MQYDAENHQTGYTGAGTTNYFYDAAGKRIEKTGAGGTTVYVYDAFGQLSAEYSNGSAAAPPCTTCYLVRDHLGSTRLVTDQNGNVVARHDYLPFGQEITAGYAGRNGQYGAPDAVNQKFTGQYRDSESGLDYFNARYYGGATGRFLSPDPANAGADPMNPQTWNAYAYVANNPLLNVDPSGMNCVTFDNGTTGDDGQGTPCPGSGDPDSITVNGGSGPPVGTWAWYMNGGWRLGDGLVQPINTGDSGNSSPAPDNSHPAISNQILAPSNSTQNNTCTQPILNAVNNTFGTNATADNVQGDPFVNGQTTNLNLDVNGLSAAQFNSLQTGRYPLNWWTYLVGYGSTLHVTGQTFFDPPPATFQNSNIGGATSVLFTAHIDPDFAYNPIGALLHGIDVLLTKLGLTHHNPCP